MSSAAREAAASRLEARNSGGTAAAAAGKGAVLREVSRLPEISWGAGGADQVRFLIATNPGEPPGPLGKVAVGRRIVAADAGVESGVLGRRPVPTLVFDEVDSGIGGATAAAVGERLARVAEDVQVLVVTHSPQVAARGAAHLVVTKAERRGRSVTAVTVLDAPARREEIARMLAGEVVTPAARAAAESLLEVG